MVLVNDIKSIKIKALGQPNSIKGKIVIFNLVVNQFINFVNLWMMLLIFLLRDKLECLSLSIFNICKCCKEAVRVCRLRDLGIKLYKKIIAITNIFAQ